MTIVLLLIGLLYAAWIIFLLRSWQSIAIIPVPSYKPTKGISIVIAFRNEAHNLERLLRSLSKQNYPLSLMEVVLVNDHSDDLYEQALLHFSSVPFSLRIVSLGEGKSGKKQAI